MASLEDVLKEYYPYPDLSLGDVTKGTLPNGRQGIYIDAIPKRENSICCPACGSTDKESNGKYVREIQDLPLFNCPTFIRIRTKQYRCKNEACAKKVFVPNFSIATKNALISDQLRKKIAEEAFDARTFSDVAEAYAVDRKTVSSLFLERLESIAPLTSYKYCAHLGVDEKYVDNTSRLVLVNTGVTPAEFIDLLERGSKAQPLVDALYRFEDYEKIETITIDMSTAYLSAFDTVYPFRNTPDPATGKCRGPRVIIDRFHIAMYLSQEVEPVRRTLYERKLSEINDIEDKNKRKIELRRFTSYRQNHYWFKEAYANMPPSTKAAAMAFCEEYPEFGVLMAVKEGFRDIYETAETRDEAEARFDEWVDVVNSLYKDDHAYDFRKFINTVQNHRIEIFNYFEDPIGARYTNAPVESLNGTIKEIVDTTAGTTFQVLRGKVLYGKRRVSQVTSAKARGPHKKGSALTYVQNLICFINGFRDDDIWEGVRTVYKEFSDKLAASRRPDYISENDEPVTDEAVLEAVYKDNGETQAMMEGVANEMDEDVSQFTLTPVPAPAFFNETIMYLCDHVNTVHEGSVIPFIESRRLATEAIEGGYSYIYDENPDVDDWPYPILKPYTPLAP